MSRTAVILGSVIAISVAAIFVAIFAFSMPAAIEANNNGTERMTACLERGGSWLETEASTSCTQ